MKILIHQYNMLRMIQGKCILMRMVHLEQANSQYLIHRPEKLTLNHHQINKCGV
jgi:hypothetical protein